MDKKQKIQAISIAIIGILYFFANMQRVAIPGAIFDTLQIDFNANAAQITALGAILMYIYAVFQLFLGFWVDKFGGKKIIKIGSIMFFIGSFLFAFARNLPFLYLSRTLVAIGVSSYYLSLISELKENIPQRNYALVLSIVLCVGYLGGIFANAPFVVLVDKYGWREVLFAIAILTGIFSCFYFFIAKDNKKKKNSKSKKEKFKLIKTVLQNHTNLKTITYACAIYGSFYVLQTVIGKKFLQDFCQFSSVKAATIMSITATMYAISGVFLAFLSKEIYHKKILFLRIVSSLNCLILFFICACLIFNIRTFWIAVMFCILALGSSISSLLVPYLQDINKTGSSTAISFMIFAMYVVVGFLGNITGFFLNLFPSQKINGIIIYNTKSYLALFIMLFIFVLIALICVFRLKESKKIQKLVGIFASHA